jgi:nucleoside-diphosphate-sugar epimerase
LQPTAFDEAVKDVDGIAHTASPFHLNAVEPIDIIDPAVRGTANILNSALKCGRLKRVVLFVLTFFALVSFVLVLCSDRSTSSLS